MQVRTRFAPSPTGILHLGNARTALFAYLYARHHKGSFILRIEDTDQERLVEGAEAAILRDLKWLGLEWDEGPDIGGPVGPYRCSERYNLYEAHLKRIRKNARVYRCFCSPDQLDQDRKLLSSQGKVIKYVGRCRDISDQDSENKAKTEKFVWRLAVDEAGEAIKIQDIIRGEVTMSPQVMGDFIIFRSTGVPVFLFANAVDDALMEISHVTRGEDHLSNTFRQVVLFRALGYKEPLFAHLPMIGDSDGGKFSKRAGSLGIKNLKEQGFIPAGVLNYLALLGWSPGDTSKHGEKFSKAELIDKFSLERVNKSRALFDPQKLRFLNSVHLQDCSLDELSLQVPASKKEWEPIWSDALALIKHDVSTLNELRKVEEFLNEPNLSESLVASQVLAKEGSAALLNAGIVALEEALQQGRSIDEALKEATKIAGQKLNVKGKQLFFPFRVALTGKDAGPELAPLAKVLGKEKVLARLKNAEAFAKTAA